MSVLGRFFCEALCFSSERAGLQRFVEYDLRPEKGQTLVEYALILALVAFVIISALTAFGVGVNALISPILASF